MHPKLNSNPSKWVLSLDPKIITLEPGQSKSVVMIERPTDLVKPDDWVKVDFVVRIEGKKRVDKRKKVRIKYSAFFSFFNRY